MKFSEIKNLTLEELLKREKSLKEEFFMLEMKHALGQVTNPLNVRTIRRNVARIKTAINQKSLVKQG